jgi:hypothetical protein
MKRTQYDAQFEKLSRLVREKCPQFEAMANDDTAMVILHQDAFAADLQDEEIALLGAFIKVLGHMGKEITITGRCRETVEALEK